jgi:hypothetical protein
MKEPICAKVCLASENVLAVAERKWIALAIEHLLIIRERSSNYPFVLPSLEIIEFSKILDALTSNTIVNNPICEP